MTFGELLHSLRSRAGLSQWELGLRASVTAGYVHRLESGERSPTRVVVESLADAMTLDPMTRSLLLSAAGFIPLTDTEYVRLIARIAAHWAGSEALAGLQGEARD